MNYTPKTSLLSKVVHYTTLLKEAKKAEFGKRIIFYCIFAPNYETNCTDIYTLIDYRDTERSCTEHS